MKRTWAVVGLVAVLALGLAGTASAAQGDGDVAMFDDSTGRWHLRHTAGDIETFFYGVPGDIPMLGDWDCDGSDTVAMYRQSNGFIYLRNTNSQGVADQSYFFGAAGDIPLAGDWDGDGCDTISIYRPSQGKVYVINTLGTAAAEFSYFFGAPGDRPFSGDFDGNAIDSVGLYRETTGLVYFRNSLTSGPAEFEFFYGQASDTIVAGDWDDDFDDTVGIFRPSEARFYLSNENRIQAADVEFNFGSGNWVPVAGSFSRSAAGDAIRINAGGPEVDAGASAQGGPAALAVSGAAPWQADTSADPISYVSGFHEAAGPASQSVTPAAGVPAEVVRWYRVGAMDWDIPLEPGRYTVRLIFSENAGASQAPGKRQFDVFIEGTRVLNDFDVYAEAGAGFTGIVRSFGIVSDEVLNMKFEAEVGLPTIAGIEIVEAPQGGSLGATPGTIDFGSTAVGSTGTESLTLVNLGGVGDPPIRIKTAKVAGADSSFAISGPQDRLVAPGGSATYAVAFNPSEEGRRNGKVRITYNVSGETRQMEVALRGQASEVILYRINAAGPRIEGDLDWNRDAGLVTDFFGKTETGSAIDLSDPSIPKPETPELMLKSERWGPMRWKFPVVKGTYEVRLYFAETFHTAAGRRVFDVRIEGKPGVLGLDVYAAAGGRNQAIMVPVTTEVTDGLLNVNFIAEKDQPMVKGIEVVAITKASALEFDPNGLTLGPIENGRVESQEITLRNAGGAGSPSVTITGVARGGKNPGQFKLDGFSGDFVLPPGETVSATVTFQPTAPGNTKEAELVVEYLVGGESRSLIAPLAGVTNLPPTAADQVLDVAEDGSVASNFIVGAADPDGNEMTVRRITRAPDNGTAAIQADPQRVRYTPDENYAGPDSFEFEVCDDAEPQLCDVAEATITVESADDAPAAVDVSTSGDEDDGPFAWTPAVSDPDGPAGLVCSIVAQSPKGTATVAPDCSSGTFSPGLNENGTATFTYRVTDPEGAQSDPATVTVTINPVNDTPSFVKGPNQSVGAGAGPQTVSGWATNISAGASDETSQTLTFLVTNDNNALFSTQPAVAADGTLTFTPANGQTGSAAVTVRLQDNGVPQETSTPQNFTISVADGQAPTWPGGASLTLSDETVDSVVLTWPAASDNVGVTGYEITWTGPGGPTQPVTVGPGTTTRVIGSLNSDTLYEFTVVAKDLADNPSTGLSATTSTLAPPP